MIEYMNHTLSSTTQLGTDIFHRTLRGIEYPISKENILNAAREHSAPEELLQVIDKLPISIFYAPEQLSQALATKID
jgi:hypothetical protein